jgi:excisionase family DNA binding protein
VDGKPHHMPRLLTVAELAGYLGASPACMYRALRLRKIPGVKIGPQWRIDLEELQDWLVIKSDLAYRNNVSTVEGDRRSHEKISAGGGKRRQLQPNRK